jgi:cytochrome c6
MNYSVGRISQMLSMACVLIFLVSASTRADDAASLFKAKCSVCHAADGSGSGPMGKTLNVPDLRSDAVQKLTDAELNNVITNGKGTKMPAYKGKLTDAQIKSLVDYIRTLKK